MFEGAHKKLHRRWKSWGLPLAVKKKSPRERRVLLHLEELETRALLSATSATPIPANNSSGVVQPQLVVSPQTSPSSISGYTPQQIQAAYGFNQLSTVNGQTIDGKGETIAIVDAYYDPNIVSDANTFNSQFSLPLFNSSGGPTLKVVASGGGAASSLPQDSTGDWPLETSLDVEWAHAMAPQANILLVESANENLSGSGSLLNAVQYAASQPGVVAVSMSWGQNEFSGESSYDSYFQPKSSSNPNGYTNTTKVTFVAAAGDSGAASGPLYPATSPYVLAVGGTTLGGSTSSTGSAPTGGFGGTSGFGFGGFGSSFFGSSAFGLTAATRSGTGLYSGTGSLSITPQTTPGGGSTSSYPGESAWSDGGGGVASYEGEPSYQYNQASIDQTYGDPNVEVYNRSTGTYSYYNSRMTPDVAYNANPSTGYAIYDSIASPSYGISGGWTEVGGTSAGSPQWAAIVALADQQRGIEDGKPNPLDTYTVQNTLYNTLSNSSTYANVFHDITTGSNGYSAGTGYDLATGLGSPIVNNLVPLLASATTPTSPLQIKGTGYGGNGGSGSSGFSGFSGFSSGSLYGFTTPSNLGGGLYTGSGSISLAPVAESSHTLPPTPIATPLNTPSPALAPNPTATAAPTALTAFSVTASPTPFAASTNEAFTTAATNAVPLQNSGVFGASGWNGAGSASSLSSLGLPGSQIEDLAGELAEAANAAGDSSTEHFSCMLADTPGADNSSGDASAASASEGGAAEMESTGTIAEETSKPVISSVVEADVSSGDATFVEVAPPAVPAGDGGGGE